MEFSVALQSYNSKTCCNGLPLKNNFYNNSNNYNMRKKRIIPSLSSIRYAAFVSRSSSSAKSDVVSSDGGAKQVSAEKKTSLPPTAAFPDGIEELILDVCDSTGIAELKVKIGSFEMHLKRNIGAAVNPMANISPTEPPPIPTKPMDVSASAAPPPSQAKPAPEKINPFANISFGKSPKLEALEASGATGYVLVVSPTVGSFCRNRTVKGKKQPPACKEGDLINEGQVIGYVDQFGTDLPVKSDVAGEVIKILYNDGDAVGYGDPLIAVLPSFHSINN